MSEGNAPNQITILKALVEMSACLTSEALTPIAGLTRRQTTDALSHLIMRGLVVRRERGCCEATDEGRRAVETGEPLTSGPRGEFRGARAVVRRGLRARAWAAIRIRRKFTLAELLQAAARGDEGDAARNVRRYLRALVAAEILTETRRAKATNLTSNGEKRYALIKDPGPVPPVISAKTGRIRGTEETR